MSPVSATYWGIPGYVFFWVLFAVAFGLFLQRYAFLYRLVRLGKPEMVDVSNLDADTGKPAQGESRHRMVRAWPGYRTSMSRQ